MIDLDALKKEVPEDLKNINETDWAVAALATISTIIAAEDDEALTREVILKMLGGLLVAAPQSTIDGASFVLLRMIQQELTKP